jgi:hypothetical protein
MEQEIDVAEIQALLASHSKEPDSACGAQWIPSNAET